MSFRCIDPGYVLKKGTVLRLPVPCRKCRPCLQQRAAEWVTRIYWEWAHHVGPTPVFVTFTYSDRRRDCVTYRDVQLFMKRLRAKHGRLRFACVREFGSKKGRKHYHAIIFPSFEMWCHAKQRRQALRAEFEAIWGIGFLFIKKMHKNSVPYLCKYLVKSLADPDQGDARIRCSRREFLGRKGRDEWEALVRRRLEELTRVPVYTQIELRGIGRRNCWIPAAYRRSLARELGVHDLEDPISAYSRFFKGDPTDLPSFYSEVVCKWPDEKREEFERSLTRS